MRPPCSPLLYSSNHYQFHLSSFICYVQTMPRVILLSRVQQHRPIVAENEYPVNASKYSCLLVHSTTPQYRGDTPEALAAFLHSEYSTSSSSSSVGALVDRCCQLISSHLGEASGSATRRPSTGRRVLHVGCATGRITYELATIFHDVTCLTGCFILAYYVIINMMYYDSCFVVKN